MGIKQGFLGGLVAVSVLGLLAGCEGVGDGSKPDASTAKLQKSGGTAALGDAKLFTCVAQQLSYTIEFTNDGGLQNFTSSAQWRTEPVVSEVATVTASGLVLPKKAGTVTVVANAFGIEKAITMNVADPAPDSLRLKAVNYGDPMATSIKMNHNTTQPLQLVGILDGFEVDLIESLESLTFDGVDEGAVVAFTTVGGQGTTIVKSVADTTKTGARTAKPKLVACPPIDGVVNDVVKDVQMTVTLAPATGMVIQRELESPVNDNVLAVNTGTTAPLVTTEILRVYATFGDSNPAQNLSNQVLATSSNVAIIVPRVAFSSQPTGITAQSTGTDTTPPALSEDVKLTYCQPEPLPDPVPSGYTSKCWEGKPTKAEIFFKTRQSILTGIAVTPVDSVIEALKTLQFRAVGTFEGGFQQDITRHVTWEAFANDGTTRSTKVGIVSAGSLLAGLAISDSIENADDDASNGTPLEDRTVKIKATNNAATTTKTQTVTATISQ